MFFLKACLTLALLTVVNCGLQLHPHLPFSIYKVESGEVFEIGCRQIITKNPINAAGTFEWSSSGSALGAEDDRVSITDGEFLAGYESVLSISDACRGHSGTYTCTYRDGDQVIVESVSFDLKILVVPSFKEFPKKQNFTEAQTNALILCLVDLGEPPGYVKWSRGGHEITDPRFTQVEQGLMVSTVMEEDQGVFKCRLERDGWGSVAKNINVVVIDECECTDPPVINTSSLLPSVTIGYDEPLVLSCNLQSGEGKVQWATPNSIVKSPNLTIHPPCTPGDYFCIAYSTNNCPSATFVVNVVVNAPPLPPTSSSNVSADVGDSILLPCSITPMPAAHPSPTYSWSKEGSQGFFPLGGSERITVDPDNQLKITEVQEGDYGIYTCAVTNPLGTSVQTVDLVSVVMPKLENATIAAMVETEQCDTKEVQDFVSTEIEDVLDDLCATLSDCADGMMVVGQLSCCSDTQGIYRATVTGLGAETLVRTFNRSLREKLHEEGLALSMCGEDGCKCEEVTITPEPTMTLEPQQSGSDATTGVIAGAIAIALILVIAVLAVLALCLFCKKRKSRKLSFVASRDGSHGNVANAGAQTAPQANGHTVLESAFPGPPSNVPFPHSTSALPSIPPSLSDQTSTSTSMVYSYPRVHHIVPLDQHQVLSHSHTSPHHPHTSYTSPHPTHTFYTSPHHPHASPHPHPPQPSPSRSPTPHSSPYHPHTSHTPLPHSYAPYSSTSRSPTPHSSPHTSHTPLHHPHTPPPHSSPYHHTIIATSQSVSSHPPSPHTSTRVNSQAGTETVVCSAQEQPGYITLAEVRTLTALAS